MTLGHSSSRNTQAYHSFHCSLHVFPFLLFWLKRYFPDFFLRWDDGMEKRVKENVKECWRNAKEWEFLRQEKREKGSKAKNKNGISWDGKLHAIYSSSKNVNVSNRKNKSYCLGMKKERKTEREGDWLHPRTFTRKGL